MAVTKLVKADDDGDVVDYSGRKLATKQSVTDLAITVGNKADASALAAKADATALAAKANTTDVNTALASKADASALTALAPKANPTFTGTVSGVTKTHVGLGNVDNTSDANKPISTLQQNALNAKLDATSLEANLAATGTPYGNLDAASGGTGAYPPRPATLRPVNFRGTNPPGSDGSTAGGGGMVPNLDTYVVWQAS